jgi:hypothetical protein
MQNIPHKWRYLNLQIFLLLVHVAFTSRVDLRDLETLLFDHEIPYFLRQIITLHYLNCSYYSNICTVKNISQTFQPAYIKLQMQLE